MGTGKTRLALQAAAEVLDEVADGVFFVDLAPLHEAGLVVSTIATTLRLRESGSQALEEIVTGYLRDKEVLLVLDNFEHVVAARSHVAALLAAPRLKVLVTSRVLVRLYGEQEYPVPLLALPPRVPLPALPALTQYEAVTLFIQWARLAQPTFAVTNATAPAVAEICHRLDGLPLANELAAARVKLLPPQALLARLERLLRVLTSGALFALHRYSLPHGGRGPTCQDGVLRTWGAYPPARGRGGRPSRRRSSAQMASGGVSVAASRTRAW